MTLQVRRVGTRTPSEVSVDRERTEELGEEAAVRSLLGEAVTGRSQAALKKLVRAGFPVGVSSPFYFFS